MLGISRMFYLSQAKQKQRIPNMPSQKYFVFSAILSLATSTPSFANKEMRLDQLNDRRAESFSAWVEHLQTKKDTDDSADNFDIEVASSRVFALGQLEKTAARPLNHWMRSNEINSNDADEAFSDSKDAFLFDKINESGLWQEENDPQTTPNVEVNEPISQIEVAELTQKLKEELASLSQNTEEFSNDSTSLSDDEISDALKPKKISLEVSLDDEKGVILSHSHLELKNSQIAVLSFSDFDTSSMKIFVRDSGKVAWYPEKKTFKAIAAGKTEIYFVHDNQLKILPITIENKENNYDYLVDAENNLSLPENTSLASIDHTKEIEALAIHQIDDLDLINQKKPDREMNNLESITTSNNSKLIKRTDMTWKNKEVAFQVFNKRVVHGKMIMDAASNVSLKVIGLDSKFKTDGHGMTQKISLPEQSRVLTLVTDSNNYYIPTIMEHFISANSKGSYSIPIKSWYEYNIYASLTQHDSQNRGSICGTLTAADNDLAYVQKIEVKVDQKEAQVVYFTDSGMPTLDRTTFTNDSGHFCVFNLWDGPVAMSFYKENSFVDVIPTNAFAGFHHELYVSLNDHEPLKTKLASYPRPYDQEGVFKMDESSLLDVDFANIYPFGQGEALQQLDFGLLSSVDPTLYWHGRSYFAVENNPAFIDSLIAFDKKDAASAISPLIPHEYLDKLYELAGITRDYSLGNVIIEHGKYKDPEEEIEGNQEDVSVNIELLDHQGNSVGHGFHYAEDPITKAAFLNVPMGTYTVVVSNKYGIVSMDTVMVYDEYTSIVRSGNKVVFE